MRVYPYVSRYITTLLRIIHQTRDRERGIRVDMLKDSLILNTEEAAQMKTIALLIQKASDFQSSIHIQCGERKANAKSLLGLMSLGLNNGDEVSVIAEGSDEKDALEAIMAWLRNPREAD